MNEEKAIAPTKNLDSLVWLRGIAVLMVCLCHFATAFWSKNSLFEYGKYGVQVFFVISGFVIPLSLQKGNFSWSQYPRFIYKRILRLYPPYLAAFGLTLIVLLIKSKTHHTPFPETTSDIIRGLFYLKIPEDNPVFWTLIVEGEYYIFIGCFFMLFFNYSKLTSFILFPLLLVISQANLFYNITFLHFIVFFFIGNVGFLIYEKIGNALINYLVLTLLLVYTRIFYNTPEFVSSLLTIFFILKVRKSFPAFLQFTGKISYSVYLIHYPVGLMIINLLRRGIGDNYIWLIFLITTITVFIASWIFYKIFEEYCEALSKKVKYVRTIDDVNRKAETLRYR